MPAARVFARFAAPALCAALALAAQLAGAVRRGILRYRDVRDAERAGYRPFLVGDTSAGAVLHSVNVGNGVRED